MKQVFFLLALLFSQPIFGFYAGVGFGWNTIDEVFSSNLFINGGTSGQDRYKTHMNRLAPFVKVGHQFFFCCDNGFVGLSAEWKYLGYNTPNENSSRGQILPNAEFSSFNFFGPEVTRDFTSKTRLNNEVMLLASFGGCITQGYVFLAFGTVFFDASNRIFVSSVHIPNGSGSHLVSTSVRDHKIIWGGAARAGYQYFFCHNYFFDISYTFLQTGKNHFKNAVNAAILNGSDTPGPVTLFLNRDIKFTVQEIILSMNFAF